ncbi:hypothetical protein [Pseudanabaena minima]|uniref:hypothetical protein n=1 Tax=Pseudanabaena minima TaxID=890415 RepID=UPI003DA8CF15
MVIIITDRPNITHKTRSPISLKLNNDRLSQPINPIAYSPTNRDRPTTPKTRSPKPQHQTAITPSPATKPYRLNLNIKQRSPKLWIFHFDADSL